MNIDYLSADGHKWLLGPEGAGIFFIRRELLERTRPPMVGWMNVINADDYGNFDFTLKPDARKFEYGTQNVSGFLALKASLELLAKVRVERIAARLKLLTDRLIDGLHSRGFEIGSPRGSDEWSGIVSFTGKTSDPAAVVRTLRNDHKIEIALREGRFRASPHFYNTEQQIDELVKALDS
jgi:selenocysteine lyase/cysteine desulfurase